MSTQLLIYETAVPVSSGRHGKASIELSNKFAFTRKVNSVPLMAVEFPEAASDYVIVFAQEGEDIVPLVVLGVKEKENLYLNDKDEWQCHYVPAFVRRYPFVFTTMDQGQNFTLCVDEAFQGLNFLGKGAPLFDAQGQPSDYTQHVLKFLQEYRVQFLKTQAFCRKLKALDILEPMQAQFTLGSGEKLALTGFLVVNRGKLKALSGDTLADLAATDELELLYLHMHSMRNFHRLKDKLVVSEMAKSAAAAVQSATTADAPSTVQ